MDREKLKQMLGMNQGGGASIYRLNKITMSGDDGSFKLTDLTSEREKGKKPEQKELGKELNGVILKMRWGLSKYDEPNKTFYGSTEYDDKRKDEVMIFPTKDKGSVEAMKDKYKLSTQRIVYLYVPAEKQITRLIVKASALSSDKNPNNEKGLFEHIDEFTETDTLPCEFVTICKGVFREGKNEDGSHNKRKDHYAMYFETGRKLNESEQEKVYAMMEEVDTKLKTAPPQDDYDKAMDEALAPKEDISDSIPF